MKNKLNKSKYQLIGEKIVYNIRKSDIIFISLF